MREIRQSGSEGGGATHSSYPYLKETSVIGGLVCLNLSLKVDSNIRRYRARFCSASADDKCLRC